MSKLACACCHREITRRVSSGKDSGRFCSRECGFEIRRVVFAECVGLRRIASRERAAARARMVEQGRARRRALVLAKLERRCCDCGSTFLQRTHLGCPEKRCDACEVTARKARIAGARRTAKARRRAVERGLHADRIDPIRVFERDKWRCHMCGCKTPSSLRGTADSRAPELDHVVTLADGGTHTWGNVACACKRCNNQKGGRSLGQIGLPLAS